MKTSVREPEITVSWSGWIDDEDDERLDQSGVLYMYATPREPIYIGKADYQTVRQRRDGHETDGVLAYLRRHYPQRTNARIKIGWLMLDEGRNFSSARLSHAERMLIFLEASEGRCRANVANTRSIRVPTARLVIRMQGAYKPLWTVYRLPN